MFSSIFSLESQWCLIYFQFNWFTKWSEGVISKSVWIKMIFFKNPHPVITNYRKGQINGISLVKKSEKPVNWIKIIYFYWLCYIVPVYYFTKILDWISTPGILDPDSLPDPVKIYPFCLVSKLLFFFSGAQNFIN